MQRVNVGQSDVDEALKKEIEDSMKKMSDNMNAGIAGLTEEIRNLAYQVQFMVDSFGKIEQQLQQQRAAPSVQLPVRQQDVKDAGDISSKIAKSVDDRLDERFSEMRSLINDVELNILSMQKKLILESKIKSK